MNSEASNPEIGALVDYLAARDVSCPSCLYNLRGLKTDRCPECHQLLTLRVGLAVPKLGSFIAGLVGLASGAGFSGLLVLYFFYYLLAHSHAPGSGLFLVITGTGFVVEGALLLLWIAQRGRIGRMSAATRVWLVVAAWALSIANLAIFTVSVN